MLSLHDRERISVQELADIFEVSLCTIYRDTSDIIDAVYGIARIVFMEQRAEAMLNKGIPFSRLWLAYLSMILRRLEYR